jgi:NTE family protein
MWKTITIILIAATNVMHAQPKNLVFEGAGVRGVAYVGAIQELEKQNILAGIERIGGTSAGAIAALTVALGYSSTEIEKIIYDTKLQKFNDGKFFFIGGISRINRNFGWYRGAAFTKWLERIIAEKTGHADITFRELHARHFPDLYITGTSLNRQQLIVFSHEQYPDMKVKDAVRISMSIPLYFEAVCIDSSGHVLKNRKKEKAYDIMVDGGFTGNFPIYIFDDVRTEQNSTIRTANPHTIGLRIDTPEQIGYDSLNKGLAPVEISRFRNYIGAFYSYVIENLIRATLTQEDWQRTVSISSGSIGPKIRKLSLVEKDLLIRNGQEAMKRYLAAAPQ